MSVAESPIESLPTKTSDCYSAPTLEEFLIAADYLEDACLCDNVIQSLRGMQNRIISDFMNHQSSRINLRQGHVIDGWTFFSDGRVLIRLRGIWCREPKDASSAKRILDVWNQSWDQESFEWEPLPPIRVDGGEGNGDEYQELAGRRLAVLYLRRIKKLGSVEYIEDFAGGYVDEHGRPMYVTEPLQFRFSYGEGILMPMHNHGSE